MSSWRLTQIASKQGFVMDQDRRLIEFVQQHKIPNMLLDGESDIGYFQDLLPECAIGTLDQSGLLAVFANELFNSFETVLEDVKHKITTYHPQYVYIAVNKYLITTNCTWYNLTDDLDADILNIMQTHMKDLGYREVARHWVAEDFGKHYNFAHPTTNAFYEI